MMIRSLLVVALVSAAGPAALAQKKPDFSGVWVPQALKTNAPAPSGGSAALPPSDLTIRQTETELSISRTVFDTVNTQTFKLDSSESTNKSGAVTRITHSRWDGARLIIEGKASQVTSAGYDAWTQKETYSIDARGRLIIEREHIPTDGSPIKSTQEYTKRGSNIRRPGR